MNKLTKELTMDKLKVLGVSALCGSLAAISAQAGEMAVSGGATATYTTKDKVVTGQPLGMASNLSFTGSGELDNGNTFAVGIYHDDKNGYSASDISVTVDGIGTFKFDQGGGTGLDRLDDKTPTAWEEAYDAGLGTNIVTVAGAGGGTDVEWAVDSGMLPDGWAAYISYAVEADGAKVNDKATGGTDNGVGTGYDIVVENSTLIDGGSLYAGYSMINADFGDDREQWAIGAKYAVGSVTLGAQYSNDSQGQGSVDYYENVAYGIAFNVNDDLSLSYGYHESEQKKGVEAAAVTLEASSFQLAYSMGGATIKVARSSAENANYSTSAANDYDVNTIALSLAF